MLLAQQHPNLATLPVRACEGGFDNYMFRLGESFAVRLPRTAAAARLLANEQKWLLTLSDRLPLQIPVPIRVGQPGFGFPWRWSVVPWLVGATAEVAPVLATQAPRLATFLRALHVPAPTDAPRNLERMASLASRAAAIAERMRHLETTTAVINATHPRCVA